MRTLLGVLIALAAACGDDENRNPLVDAPPRPDAPADGPTSGPVSITITQDGEPQVGVRVHFQNADSSLVATVNTDSNGVATATMEAGGFVTAIDPFTQPVPQGIATNELFTFSAVKPLDELKLTRGGFDEPVTNLTVTFTADPNASRYDLYAGCMPFQIDVTDTDGSGGSGGPGGPVSMFGCAPGSTTDLLLVAYDIEVGLPFRTIHVPNVTLTERGTIDLGSTFTDTQGATFSYTGVPPNIGSVNVDSALVSSRGVLFQMFDSAIIDNGSAMTTTQQRAVVPNTLQVTSTRMFGPNNSSHRVLEWGPPTQAYSLALDNVLIGDYAEFPQFDIATHSTAVTLGAGGATPDLAFVEASFLRESPAPLFWIWDMAAPFGTGTFAYPVLPGEDAQFNPIEGDLNDVEQLSTAIVPGGYDAVRETVFSLDDLDGLVSGASGRAVIQELSRGKLRKKLTASKLLRPWAVEPGRAQQKLLQKQRKRR